MPGVVGLVTVTVNATDSSGLKAADTFQLAITGPPAISDIADQTITAGTSTQALPVTVSDDLTAPAAISLTGVSGNAALVPPGNIVFGGAGANRTVTVTPAPGQSGVTTISVTATDGNGLTRSESFVLTVQVPFTVTITSPTSAPATTAASALMTLAGTASSANPLTRLQWMTDRGASGDGTFTVPQAAASRLWTAEVALGAGTTLVTVMATDSTGATATDTLTVTATAFLSYLAEGAAGPFFSTQLALLNPGDVAVTATLTYLPSRGTPLSQTLTVPARTRATVDPATLPGFAFSEFSTAVSSTGPLVVDRTMVWDGRAYGAHAETAVSSPALTWYLAEGSTSGGFNLFYLLQNPNTSAAQVKIRYLRGVGAPLEQTYVLPPQSRTNVWANLEQFAGLGAALAASDVSGVIEVQNGQPIIVERAMYLNLPGQTFGAGHESAGITAPATQWFLAEGSTGSYFDLFVLIANPSSTEAQVQATSLLPDGTTVTKAHSVPANSRYNIWVDLDDPKLARHGSVDHRAGAERCPGHRRAVHVVAGQQRHLARGAQRPWHDSGRLQVGAC